jgi:hypothetical protein
VYVGFDMSAAFVDVGFDAVCFVQCSSDVPAKI